MTKRFLSLFVVQCLALASHPMPCPTAALAISTQTESKVLLAHNHHRIKETFLVKASSKKKTNNPRGRFTMNNHFIRSLSTRGGGGEEMSPMALHGVSQLSSSVVISVNAFYKNFPYIAAFLTCGFKASLADFVAQRRQSRIWAAQDENNNSSSSSSKKLNLERNLAFLFYGAIYQGVTQEFLYNDAYNMLFSTGTGPRVVLLKVLFDMFVQTPLLTLPIAYLIKAMIYRYPLMEGLRRYWADLMAERLLMKYVALWGPVQSLTFSIVPEHFRVSFIAFVSFFWLIIFSSLSSKRERSG